MISMQDILQTIVNSLPTIGRYALVTIGIVLIFRTTATTNFAQGLIATFGTFVVTWASLTGSSFPMLRRLATTRRTSTIISTMPCVRASC